MLTKTKITKTKILFVIVETTRIMFHIFSLKLIIANNNKIKYHTPYT